MFPRRRFGSAFGRRGGRGRRFGFFKPALLTTNHCEASFVTTGGTENNQTMFTAVSGPSNRSTHIPEQALLTYVDVRLWATDATPVAGKHQCILWLRPGGHGTVTTPIASYYSTVDPLNAGAYDIRRFSLAKRKGVETRVIITGHDRPPFFRCTWRGKRVMRDGDDIVVTILDANATNWTADCRAGYIF